MAWLQRLVNGGGTISRGYASGLGRLDRLRFDSGWLIIFSRQEVTDWDMVGRQEIIKGNCKKNR